MRFPEIQPALRRTIILWTLLVIGSLGLVAFGFGFHLRGSMRSQILNRDVAFLESVFSLVRDEALASGLSSSFEYIEVAAAVSDLRGILAVEILDGVTGEPIESIPYGIEQIPLTPEIRSRLDQYGAVAEFFPQFPLEALFVDAEVDEQTQLAPIEKVVIRIPGDFEGDSLLARYWMDGSSIEREFTRLDRNLWIQGTAIWVIASLLIAAISLLAGVRVSVMAAEVDRHARELQQANSDLDLAARSSAVGAISAHLIHGLKNPLAGLKAYLKATGDEEAGEATRRMEILIRDSLETLKYEGVESSVALECDELLQSLRKRVLDRCGGKTVELKFRCEGPSAVRGRDAGILLCILENLCMNSVEAVESDSLIRIEVSSNEKLLTFKLNDNGPGIPGRIRSRLFDPGVSTKGGGSGLGLAISRQLTRSLNGELRCLECADPGAHFELVLPNLCNQPQNATV